MAGQADDAWIIVDGDVPPGRELFVVLLAFVVVVGIVVLVVLVVVMVVLVVVVLKQREKMAISTSQV